MLITQLHLRPTEVREAAAPPQIINSEHKCASLINMKRQWGRTTLSPAAGKVWACRKDYARNQYSSGPKKKGVEVPRGSRRKTRVLRTPKVLTPEQGP